MALSKTAELALAAYGGRELWSRVASVDATLSAWGLAFRLKWQRPFTHVRVHIDPSQPSGWIQPIDKAGRRGVLDGPDVRLEDSEGYVLEVRPNARRFFPGGRRLFWWDRMDQTYFAGYALWNYTAFPALLLRPDILWNEEKPGVLLAEFPDTIPTHSKRQRFHFDPATGLLLRHDYTAEIFGRWAKASMTVLEHAEWKGIRYVSRRRATPRGASGRPRRGPTLVEIHVLDWRLERR